jgi:hypothetical protein
MRKVFTIMIVLLALQNVMAQTPLCYKNSSIESHTLITDYSSAFEDLNNDGYSDLIIAQTSPNKICIYYGNNTGTYTTFIAYNVTGIITSFKIKDVNSDGIKDILFFGGVTGIMLGNVANGFDPINYFTVTGSLLEIDDFDGDSNVDLLMLTNNSFYIRAGNGNGIFSGGSTIITGVAIGNVKIVDCNNDNILDVVAVESGSSIGKISIYLGNKNSQLNCFNAVVNYTIGASVNGGFLTKDFNNDGYLDIVATTSVGISIMLNNGNGTYGAPVQYFTLYNNPRNTISEDFNNDGKMDLLVGYGPTMSTSNNLGGKLRLYIGNGLGSFNFLSEQKVSFSTPSMLSGDINNDGNKDIIGINGSGSIYCSKGDGTGYFNTTCYGGIHAPGIILDIVDLNGDNLKEIIVRNSSNTLSTVLELSIIKPIVNSGYDIPVIFPTNGENDYTGVDVQDYNNDGNKDVAVTSTDSLDRLSIYYSNSLGQLNTPLIFSKPRISSSNQKIPISADFNQDGFLDIIFSSTIFFGNASGITTQSLTTLSQIFGTADFNHDGKTDLVSYGGQYAIGIQFGNGNGTFSGNYLYGTGEYPSIVNIADLNNDGNLDIITGNWAGSSISVLKGSNTGTFSAAVNYTTGSNPRTIRTADFNLDGFLDVAVANNNSTAKNISILLGSASGSLTTYTTIPLGSQPKSMTIGDINADGVADIIVTVYNGYDGFMFFKGLGTGDFSLVNKKFILYHPDEILATDLNHDNMPDLIASSTGFLSVLYSGAPNILINGLNTACVGLSIPLNVVGANTYTWSTNENTSSIIVSPSVTTTYSVVGQDALGCSNSAVTIITVNPNIAPTIAISGNTVLCSSLSTSLTASGANTYTWSNGSNNPTINYSPIANTTLSVTGTDINGCQNTGSININILPLPNTSLSSNLNTVCGVISTTLSVLGSASNTISWSTGASTPSIIVTPSVTTVYSVVTTGTNSCTKNLTKTITVLNIPAISVSGPTIVCKAVTNTLVASGVSTYTWSGGGITGTTAPTVTIGLSSNTNFFVQGTAINGCTTTATYSVDVYPYSAWAINRPQVCSNSITTFSVGGCTSCSSYSWSNGAITPTIQLNPTVNGSVSVTFLSQYFCPNNLLDTYTVYPTPTLSIVAPNSICSGNSATLSVTGASSYIWNNNSSASSLVVNPTTTTTYTVIGKSAAWCYKTDTVQVKVNYAPNLSILPISSICAGNSTSLAASGASNYLWNTGEVLSIISVTPSITQSYSVTGTNSCGSSTKSISVIVNQNPTIAVNSGIICNGQSFTITPSGANTYTYSGNSNIVSPTINTTYTVIGTDVNNCSTTQTVSVTVDNTCADVWPGDANSDGAADNLDILELGLHYAQTGASRATTSNNWQSYFAINWSGTITNGKNLNHSDCNGDGVINDDDTLAIFNNYSLIHAFKTAQTTTLNPQLSIVPDQASVVKGTWGSASVYLGDAANVINNINGIAFTVDFDNALIETNSIYLEYQNSFIDASQNLHFRKLNFANGKICTATTHTVNNNVSGFGKIATLHYQIKSSLATDEVLNIGLAQANQSDASGLITPLTSGTGTLMAVGSSVGIKEVLNNSNVSISPNPTNGILNIVFGTIPQNTKIDVYNSIGALVLTETLSNKNNTINTSYLSDGMYLIKVLENNRVVALQKIVKQ